MGMIAGLVLAVAMQAAPVATPGSVPAADEIVVRAVRHKCRVLAADRYLSEREFDARAKLWAGGVPVRVVAPAGADYPCLAKIAFKLHDKGVRLIDFVDPPERP